MFTTPEEEKAIFQGKSDLPMSLLMNGLKNLDVNHTSKAQMYYTLSGKQISGPAILLLKMAMLPSSWNDRIRCCILVYLIMPMLQGCGQRHLE